MGLRTVTLSKMPRTRFRLFIDIYRPSESSSQSHPIYSIYFFKYFPPTTSLIESWGWMATNCHLYCLLANLREAIRSVNAAVKPARCAAEGLWLNVMGSPLTETPSGRLLINPPSHKNDPLNTSSLRGASKPSLSHVSHLVIIDTHT